MSDTDSLGKEIQGSHKAKEQQPQLIDKRKEAKKRKREAQLRFEKRVLVGAFALGLLGSLFFMVSFCTSYWVVVELKEGQEKDDYERGLGKYLKMGHHHGLWTFCRDEVWPGQNQTTFCRKMTFDVLPNTRPNRMEFEIKMADFRRSTVAVGIIALVLSIMAHSFTWYSIQQARYMFKRLAGCLHFITGASCWVVTEVFRQSMLFEEKSLLTYVKEFSSIHLGWSYYLMWASIVAFVVPGCLLLYYSRKRKGENALNVEEAQENEPVYLGRV